ncbi:MAG: class I SAM-dependent methyltransferase [Arcobacter sp.]|nr:class I SAM-dependent methyltransferase [Arcobacter sp.]
MKTICKICENSAEANIYNVKEMMFGLRDEFGYFECNECGCLQLNEVPSDLTKYYSKDYYSFKLNNDNFVKKYLKKQRGLAALNIKSSLIGKLSSKLFNEPDYSYWLNFVNVKPNSKILDVGCGSGNLLFELLNVGFNNLYGIDPFIKKSIVEHTGLKIIKGNIGELTEKFDVILFNHSFEHLAEQFETLAEVKKLLNPNGKVIIRIPIAAFAWNKYKVNWAGLDAPRHIFLHTVKSFDLLANKSGFKVINYKFDSTDFQFWASEQYKNNIPHLSEKSYRIDPTNSKFSEIEIKQFKEKADELNKNDEGDQAGFILVHSNS